MRRLAFRLAPVFLAAVLVVAPAIAAPAPIPRAKPTPPPLWKLFSQPQYTAAKNAIDAANKGDWLTAQGWAAATGEPVFQDVVQWLEMKDNGSRPNFPVVKNFIASHPDWPSQTSLLRTAERSAAENGSNSEVINWFATHPATSAKGRRRQAEILITAGKRNEGNEALRDLWRDGRFSKSEAKSFRKSYGHLLNRKDHESRLSRALAGSFMKRRATHPRNHSASAYFRPALNP